MNKVLLLLATLLISFSSKAQLMKTYTSEWDQINGFLKKGLTQSAETATQKIFDAASKEKNTPQIIKAAMFLTGYKKVLTEETEFKNHLFLDTLISKSNGAAKAILQSMQAQYLQNYFAQNRWRFYNRTEQTEEKATDIQTWSLDKLHKTISQLYSTSLKDAKILQGLPSTSFEPIILKGENTNNLRPTMYDLIAFRALDYFSSTETYITKPSYYFQIEQKQAYSKANEFVNYSFKSKDTLSNHFKALKLYQELLDFRLKNGNTDALIDADILRLQFVHNNSVHENKEILHKEALENIVLQFPNHALAANAKYLIAENHLFTETKTPEAKSNNEKAKRICEDIIKQFPKSEAATNATNLLNRITGKQLNFTSELVNLPNEPFRISVEYRNTEKAYIRVIKTTYEAIEKLNKTDYDKIWTAYAALKPSQTYTFSLPQVGDFLSHRTEAKLNALDNGIYIILMSAEPDFKTGKNILAKNIFHVSNISLINKTSEYHVLHRNTGEPLANATVKVYESKYNYDTRRQETNLRETIQSNNNGYFSVKINSNESVNLNFDIQHQNDQLHLFNNFYSYYNGYNEESRTKQDRSFLFTDRAIYRPGQSLYFKGIVINEISKPYKATVVPNKKLTVILYDANHQKVNSVQLTTNEYGSYNGVFTLPAGGLTGQFYIQDSTHHNNKYIRVEEYKRPKFAVEIQQPKGSYRVNDSIKVTGLAKAFAGNNIDGAKVKYRVTRKTVYPIWWYDWGMYARRGGKTVYGGGDEQVEITNGETTTNEKGEFTVKFKAIPDATIEKKAQPTFYYELNADVTDINGETRSNQLTVPVSYQALKIELGSLDKTLADSLKQLYVQTKNINGFFEAASVSVLMYELKAPTQYLRNRYWEKPDTFIMTEKEFKKDFPIDVYKDENEKATWQKAKIEEFLFTTEENKHFQIPVNNLPYKAGHYQIEVIAKDKYGETVKEIQYFELTDTKPVNYFTTAIDIKTNKAIVAPGETIQYNLVTAFDKLFVIHEQSFMTDQSAAKKEEQRLYEYITNKNNTHTIKVNEADCGGIAVSTNFVKYNRVFGSDYLFSVPWTNKTLNIQFETFRDKTLPGSEEEYKVKVSGNLTSPSGGGLVGVAAEMLATMYDASLDEFVPHEFDRLNLYPGKYNQYRWNGASNFQQDVAENRSWIEKEYKDYSKTYDQIGIKIIEKKEKIVQPLWWLNPLDYAYGNLTGGNYRRQRGEKMLYDKSAPAPPGMAMEEMVASDVEPQNKTLAKLKYNPKDGDGDGIQDELDKELNTRAGNRVNKEGVSIEEGETNKKQESTQPRKNFNETAFFLPDLKTDANGNIIIKYKIPEALTKWKLLALAHTKEMAIGTAQKELITQKPLMVQPNLPRFVREGDKIDLAVKIVNLSDKEISGSSSLELINPETNQSVDGWFKNMMANQYFTVPAGQSTVVNFPIEIPFNYNKPLVIRTTAKNTGSSSAPVANGASDAEENIVPVVTNRMLITETMPLPMKGIGTKQFSFSKLLNSHQSSSLSHQGLTVEFTSNPIWYAVQALPYLMEYPYECAEQTFNRYYANALASKIANSSPKIKAVFDKWKQDGEALKSNLEKNQELKTALLEETPWVLDAQNEAQQKRNIALLFDLLKLNSELQSSINKLKEMQTPNGGFSWFKGGRDDRYITQYIITGIGHLKKLGVNNNQFGIEDIVRKAIPYLDARFKEDYDRLINSKANLKNDQSGYTEIQYLYMRSFFKEYVIPENTKPAVNYHTTTIEKYWLQKGKYMQGMIALILHRNNNKSTPTDIFKSLKENAIVNEELGMYWKDISGGYYWHQAPIETMSLLIEAFNEASNDAKAVNELKTWLLKNKQTSNWKTTKATAEACYALLMPTKEQGDDMNAVLSINNEIKVEIQLGKEIIKTDNNKVEEGTGYLKKRIDGEKVKPEMGNVTVTTSLHNNLGANKIPPLGGGGASWGSVYWQYFEDLDKITPAATPLQLKKKIFKQILTDKGVKLQEIKENDQMKVGDKMIVRIELKVDRDMEYIHMKDMRSSGTEPVNVLSQYKWQDGLGYYESTKDVSTNFFFNYLPKGTYVFEYPLNVSHKGNFSNGVTTIQCMYAPEFSSHSEGVRVNVE